MIILKRGVTGFFESADSKLSEMSFSSFRKICYSLRLEDFVLTETVQNKYSGYYYAKCRISGNNLYILLNRYYPFIAFTENLSYGEKVFKDVPALEVFFYGYNVLKADILNSPFRKDESELSECELRQIDYYSPVTFGNVIFNEWD